MWVAGTNQSAVKANQLAISAEPMAVRADQSAVRANQLALTAEPHLQVQLAKSPVLQGWCSLGAYSDQPSPSVVTAGWAVSADRPVGTEHRLPVDPV